MPIEENGKKYLTVKEAAEYLRLKETTVYHYIHNRKIAFHKSFSRVLFTIEDLDNFVLRNRFEIED